MTRLLPFLLALFTTAALAAPMPKGSPKPQPDSVVWTKVGTIANDPSNYTPVVPIDATHMRLYANTPDNVNNGDLWLRNCSWSSCGSASKVLHIDVARDTYIRTSGIAKGASGTYYAVLYTGDGYPTQGGYSPSWATSPDGLTWAWWGPVGIFGRNQSSAMNLIVDESRTDDRACMAWLDLPNTLPQGAGLVLMHSALPCMPDLWRSDGANMWPIAGEEPQFVAAVRTPYGYHLIGANTYPATALRHVFSCTGLPPWHVLEMASDVINMSIGKGTNLAYDPSTNLIHAVTSGVHWTLSAKAYPC